MVFEEERGNDMESIINVLKKQNQKLKKGNQLSYYFTLKWEME